MIRKLLPILGITFIDIVGFSMLLPVMPYFVTHFGMPPIVVGVLMATFGLCQLVAAALWGNISDRIGRKAVLIISQIGATIGWAMLAFAPNVLWVFIARIVEGVSGGNISVTQAYVADLVEPKDRARAFGLIAAMFGAGMIFGPIGGGLLYLRFGFASPFLAAAALQLITLILTIVLLPESRSVSEDDERVGVREILRSFSRPALAPLLWQKLAISLGLYGWFAVIALYLKAQLGFSLFDTDVYMGLFAAVNVVVNGFLIGKISSALGNRTMSNLGLASLAASFAMVPFIHTAAWLVLLMVLFSFGVALTNTGIMALISNAASDREQGTILGTSSSLDSTASVVAPLASTGLLTAFGSRLAGIESLAFTALALVMGLFAKRGEQPGTGGDSAAIKLTEMESVAEAAEG